MSVSHSNPQIKSSEPQASDADGLQPVPEGELPAYVEAALLASDRPLPAAKVAQILGCNAKAVQQAVEALNEHYEQSQRSFRIENVAGGFQMLTLPRFGAVASQLQRTRSHGRLSASALETLAIIAYKQPILRAELEAIRGVACGEVLRNLMERHLVKIVGRAEEIGRPMLYGTTKGFLEAFGLSSLKDLPTMEQFRQQLDNGGSAPAEAKTTVPA